MPTSSTTSSPPTSTGWKRTAGGLSLLAAVYFAVVYLIPRPESVDPAGWRLTGLFLATIAGSIFEPIPAGALVLLAITLASLIGGLTIGEALSGYSNASVWLVLIAFFIARALLRTGLARRIALVFVRAFGRTSLGIAYSLAVSDMVLAAMIPSNGARSGGVTLPIVRSISELYGSSPGATAHRIGSYLMTAVYQSVCVTSAMFITGQVSNFLARDMAADVGYEITPLLWFRAAIVPGLLSLIVIPWLTWRINRPEIRRTPEARDFAAGELAKLGPMSRQEWILAVVFAVVCFFWMVSQQTGVDVTVTAILGCMALLFTGVLTWDDIPGEKAGWAIFIWYGGIYRLAQGLNDAGVARAFAAGVGSVFEELSWPALLAITVVVYFYAHYAFASITAHMVSMFPAFLALLLMQGAPIGLAVWTFAGLANLSACLTHYGTTPAPIYFAQGYTSLPKWWQVGAINSVAHLIIWTTAGFAWWKLIGIW